MSPTDLSFHTIFHSFSTTFFVSSKLTVLKQKFEDHYLGVESGEVEGSADFDIMPNLNYLDSDEIQNKLKNKTEMPFMLRAFDHYFPDIHMLENYGCWCYFYDVIPYSTDRKGRGQPVDDFDALCKQLHEAYECAVIDNEEQGLESCVPWEVEYSTAGLFYTFESLTEACETANDGDSCKVHACVIEANFVSEVIDLVMIGNQIPRYASFKHDNGFDAGSECGNDHKTPSIAQTPTALTAVLSDSNVFHVAVALNTMSFAKPLSVTTENTEKHRINLPAEIVTESGFQGIPTIKTCCGKYPKRFPYTTKGERGCCGQKTFNAYVFHCCEENFISLSCA